MCQPGRPRPQGESHHVSSPGLLAVEELVRALAGELPVFRVARDAEVDVALDVVREAALVELRDEADDLRNRLGRPRQVVGPAEPERVGVLEVPLRRARGELGTRTRRGPVDLVVDVGDVVDERDVVAAPAEPAPEPHPEHERAGVPDVRTRIDGGAADVHPDRPGRRRQLLEPSRERVVQTHGAILPHGGLIAVG